MKKNILIVLILLTYYVSSAQEKFTFRDISNYGVYTIEEDSVLVPNYNAEQRVPMYNGKYNNFIGKFIEYYEIQKPSDSTYKANIKSLLEQFKPVFNELKSKENGNTHFKDIEFNSPKLLEATKKELEIMKGEIVTKEFMSVHEIAKLPKKKINIQVIKYLDDKSGIKGEYYIADIIKVASENSYQDKTYKNQVIENGKEVKRYDNYTYFKSVDGTGVDFYNSNIDIYDEYAVNRAPKPLTSKEKNIVAKMKIYKVEMKSLMDGMAQFRSNLSVARDATVKGQSLQKKVNFLYNNDDDRYYDFVQLLDYDTISVMSEFNQVLKGSVILFGL